MAEDVGRRLPVYLVLDVSGSMHGEPIEACRQGLKALLSELRSDPQALETAWLSVITFSNGANQVCPLTDLMDLKEPELSAGGGTDLGAGLLCLMESIDREVRKAGPGQRGDYRPLVFLMSDGQPNDDWRTVADKLKQRRLGNLIACAAGPGADVVTLQQLTETVVQLQNLQPETLKAFFRWVSGSVRAVSVGITPSGPIAEGVLLPPPPPNTGIVIVT